jgi:hypothetical protein
MRSLTDEVSNHTEGAKTAETRERRIEKALSLLSGKR